jgi:hypothetical protein
MTRTFGDTEADMAEKQLAVLRASGALLPMRCKTGKQEPYLLECYDCGARHGEGCRKETRAEVAELFGIDTFTCDDCPRKYECKHVFDAYNTEGDCLADK